MKYLTKPGSICAEHTITSEIGGRVGRLQGRYIIVGLWSGGSVRCGEAGSSSTAWCLLGPLPRAESGQPTARPDCPLSRQGPALHLASLTPCHVHQSFWWRGQTNNNAILYWRRWMGKWVVSEEKYHRKWLILTLGIMIYNLSNPYENIGIFIERIWRVWSWNRYWKKEKKGQQLTFIVWVIAAWIVLILGDYTVLMGFNILHKKITFTCLDSIHLYIDGP